MAAENIPVIKRSLLSWVWPGNGKLQLLAVLVISITVGARLLPMEMQKRIINQAIALRDLDLLLVYCAFYLGAVILATGLKFVLNTIQTAISQRVLARMRQELYHHLLTLPLSFFRKTQPGMVVSSLVTELVPAGDLAGMALTVPLINIGTVLAFGVYLFYLNWILAIITLSISPLVLFLLPVLQKKSNKANRQRLDLTRLMSNRITDTITGIHEVHGHGSFHIENKKYDVIVEKLRKVRIVWTLYNNLVKVASNFFTGLGPFLVFLIGGYMAMKGQLALGALVAFVSAQDRLYDPWKELIDFYQIYQDAVVRYKKTMEYFDAWPEFILEDADRPIGELDGGVEVKNLSFETEDGISLISGLNFTLNPGEHMALVGFSGSGKSTLAQCVGQLYKYTGGQVTIGGREVAEMSKAEMVHNMGYVSQSPFIFAGTIEENLLYSFAADRARHARGPDAMPTLDDIIGVLQQTGVFVDVLRFGLNAIMDKEKDKELIANLIKVRASFLEDFGQEMAPYIEFFQEDHFLNHSSIADNLIFGAPNRDDFSGPKLGQNDYFLKFLDEADLTRPLLSLGSQLARQTVDILGNLVPDKAFFEHSPVGPDELDAFKEVVERLKKKKLHEISAADHASLLDLALRFTPGRHKMVGLPDMLKGLILEGRALFKERISEADPGAITFFQKSDYIYTETILNNIIFGRTKTGKIEVQEKINQSIIRLLIEEDYLEAIVKIGMQFDVGSKGDNLSGGQRQKLAIARAFLKNPKLLILDEATSALDNKSQGRIQNQLETRWKGKTTVIAVVHRLDITKSYDKIAVMKAGKIVEIGSYPELIAMKGIYHELVQGKK